jgi:putative ABC transport system permease protein
MICDYFKSIIRNLRQNKTSLFINLFGLTLGIASVMLISAYILSELNVGKEFKDASSIYLVEAESTPGLLPLSPLPLAGYLKNNQAVVEEACVMERFNPAGFRIKSGGSEYLLKNMISVDKSFFKMFPYKTILGNPQNAMENPNSIVFTQSEAKRIFGDENPMGKSIVFEKQSEHIYTVGAVIEDITTGNVNYFQSVKSTDSPSFKSLYGTNAYKIWGMFYVNCFLKISSASDIEKVATAIDATFREKIPGLASRWELKTKLVAYDDIYFSKVPLYNTFRKGNFKFVISFIAVAFIILIIAIINFINLTNAQGLSKAKEIGIRKVNGSSRIGLINRFVLESLLLNLVAFAISTILILLVRSIVTIGDLEPVYEVLFSLPFLVIVLFGSIIIGIVAGIIPGFHLTGINLIKVLEGEKLSMSGGSLLKMSLTSFQFIVAILLIVSVLTINKQMNFILHKDIGFKANNLIYFNSTSKKQNVLRDMISSHASIEDITYTNFIATGILPRNEGKLKMDGRSTDVKCVRIYGDEYLLETMEMELFAGRNFHNNENAIIINETAANLWGIADIDDNIMLDNRRVVGIVKDFNTESLHRTVEPVVVSNDTGGYCVAKITANPAEVTNAIEHIKSVWKEVESDLPPDINFMDESINNMYKKEAHFKMVLNVFALLAIFISIIGLFGISLYLITAQIKEIGIRKVNGAKVSEILIMLNASFVKWVAIAYIIATPIAYYAMQKWLENFAYKTEISWWIFALAGALALAISILTITWQSWKAATRNPVEALRYE